MIEIDARLYNALLSLLALAAFILSFCLTSRLFKRKPSDAGIIDYIENHEYTILSIGFIISILVLTMIFSMNLGMFLVDLIFGSEMKMITLSEAEIIRHIILFSTFLSVVGSVFAVLSRDD